MPVELLTNSFFLGYGLGGYVAHALTIEVERHGHNIPGVILAGTTPVTVRNLSPSLSGLDDEGCFEWLMGSNRAAATDTRRVLFDVFKNAIRADLEAYDGYMPNARVNAPVLVMGGSHDPSCSAGRFTRWSGARV